VTADYSERGLRASSRSRRPRTASCIYNYSTIASYGKNTAVKAATGKYLHHATSGTQNALKYVYFVPAADSDRHRRTWPTRRPIRPRARSIGTGKISFTVTGRTSSSYYYDVTASNTGSWSANAVDFMAYNGLVKGTGNTTYSPYMAMTRAMFVTVLYRAAGEPSVSSIANPFKDVKSGEYYYNAVLWAYRNNIVTGTSGTAFNPDGKITREADRGPSCTATWAAPPSAAA
jgi:hypothetical protein